jgi:hypothetical protein
MQEFTQQFAEILLRTDIPGQSSIPLNEKGLNGCDDTKYFVNCF